MIGGILIWRHQKKSPNFNPSQNFYSYGMYILWMWSSGILRYNLYSWAVSQCLFCTTKIFICVRISIIVTSSFLKVYRMYKLVIVLYWILMKSLKIIWSSNVHAVGFSTRWQNGMWYNITSWLLNWFPLVRASVCVCVCVCLCVCPSVCVSARLSVCLSWGH